jgi:regulator of replication initiation timing
MTQQSEHLMELANEIVRLRTENEKLKRQLDFSVSYEMVRLIKTDLYNALDEARIVKEQNDHLMSQNAHLASTIDSIKTLIS